MSARIAAVAGRGNTLMVFAIMTAVVVIGSVLVGWLLGPNPTTNPPAPGSPGSDSSPTVPSEPEETSQSEDPDAGEDIPEPDFVLATFNVLGNSHTKASGKEPELDSGPRRLRKALRLIDRARVDVVGLQELQRPQALAFESRVGDKWRLFHSADDSENSIAWKRTEWRLLTARTVAVPYFNGNTRQKPVVRLRHRDTGAKVWFINVHNPANTAQFPAQENYRAQAIAIEMRLAERLARGKSSVILMGDLNMRAEAFCYFTKSGTLVSATGEPREKPCQEPAYGGIDWIFGTPDLEFTDWSVTSDDVVGITSDHPLVTVSVGLPG